MPSPLRRLRGRWPGAVALLSLALALPRPAPAEEPEPAERLRGCDALTSRKEIAAARACYLELAARHPGTAQARDAERSLSAMDALAPPPGERRYFVLEPYSARTHERLRLSSWEKLDFGATAFVYGLSTGLTAGLATNATIGRDASLMAAGAVLYTGLAVTFVNVGHVDRGDLPVALSIASYVPLTTALVAVAGGWEAQGPVGGAIAASALVSMPVAAFVAGHTDADPGDAQLVRDAGFWGLVIAFTASGAVSRDETPRRAAVSGLAGLYGGLALGLLAAHYSEVSLERVRLATWGGYGGALLGFLAAGATQADLKPTLGAIGGGSALGLIATFLATSAVDDPPSALSAAAPRLSLHGLEPTLLPMVGSDGRVAPRPAVTVLRGRF
jgi:hypothetical protein